MQVELSQQEAELLLEILKRLSPNESLSPTSYKVESQTNPFDEYSEDEIAQAMKELACLDAELEGMQA